MSGPTTASFVLQARQVRAARSRHLHLQMQRLQSKLSQLQGIAAALGLNQADLAPPPNLEAAKPSSDGDHVQLIKEIGEELERLTRRITAARDRKAQAAKAMLATQDLPPIEEALHHFMVHRALHTQLDASQSQAIVDSVARILARLDLDEGEPLPQDLVALGRDMALAPSLERAELLGLELRLRVQNQRHSKAIQRAGQATAASLLEAMGDDAPLSVRELLEAVVLGDQPLSPDALALAQRAEQAVARQRQETAASILEQSLQDLGYAVDGIDDTLFLEGGLAHFQRHGWNDYFVQVRVQPTEQTLNFNVVRARGTQETAERKRLDFLAEDRWCAEFPKLLETLAARGVKLNVTRLLGAGELPVQAVDPASLPQAAADDVQRQTARLRAMPTKD